VLYCLMANHDDPLYPTWQSARARCTHPQAKGYKNYGGRGISMLPAWVESFPEFRQWVLVNLGERPEGMTLDRKDTDGNYEPGNLQWATYSEQASTRRRPCDLQVRLDAAEALLYDLAWRDVG
jgi:hypothetical protein